MLHQKENCLISFWAMLVNGRVKNCPPCSLLFYIYVDDLENYLSANWSVPLEFDKMFNTENVLKLLVLLYANDTLILADSPENLEKSLHNLSLYCQKWHLTVNENQTHKLWYFLSVNLNIETRFITQIKKWKLSRTFSISVVFLVLMGKM